MIAFRFWELTLNMFTLPSSGSSFFSTEIVFIKIPFLLHLGETWGFINTSNNLPSFSSVLSVDWWLECAARPRNVERTDTDWPGYLAVHGAQAMPARSGEHLHTRCPTRHSKAPLQPKFLLWFHPYWTIRADFVRHVPPFCQDLSGHAVLPRLSDSVCTVLQTRTICYCLPGLVLPTTFLCFCSFLWSVFSITPKWVKGG